MPAGQRTAHFFRILYFSLFVFVCLLIFYPGLTIDPSIIDLTQVFKILDYIMLMVQGLVQVFGALAIQLVLVILSVKSKIPLIGDEDFGAINLSDIQTKLAQILNPSNNFLPHSTITELGEEVIADFFNFFGATTILVLIPIAVLSGIGFLREGDTKLAIYSFLGFQLIIIIAIFTKNILIQTDIRTGSIIDMLFSPLFSIGFLLYLLLEVAFQTSYTLNIIEPMTEREKRILEHLKRIRTFVPKSEEEEKGREQSVQNVQSKKFGLLAASYLREMVERRIFKKGEQTRDSKSMMRLQSYLANLNQTDPEIDLKLAAKTAQPDVSALIKHFIPAMLFRIVAVVFLSYVIMSPEGILNLLVAAAFPALLDSLELSQPEFRTIAIINVALIFILFGAILHYLTSGRTGKVLERVVKQIDTLVDFDRGTKSSSSTEETDEEADESQEEQDEEI
ncbi:MAG: hypothetical protein ACTSW1_05380 [Candidatus Hodarchaeales archaeon]